MAPLTRLSLLFLSSAYFAPHISAYTQCYYPDGSIPVDYLWEPCIGTGHSSCCIPTEGDICQPNGLCYYAPSNNTFRGACTDRTWNDPACPKDFCVQGNEDTWAWSTPCAKNTTDPSQPDAFACGTRDKDNRKTPGLCPTTAQSTYYQFFITTQTTAPNTKPTRYTSPPAIDTSKYSVYTETYTATISAWIQTTTFVTKWESTFTSELAGSTATPKTGASTSQSNTADTPQITSLTPSSISSISNSSKSGITLSPGVLAAAIGAPIIGLGILAWLLFYFRARRQIKNGTAGGAQRLDSSAGPQNGPVGAAQVVPYEVPATEVRGSRPGTAVSAGVGGYYGSEKVDAYGKAGEGVYEMSGVHKAGIVGGGVGDEKNGYLSPTQSVREVNGSGRGSPRSPQNGLLSPVSPISPGSGYHDAVELDGGSGSWGVLPLQQQQQSTRPVGSNRNGVGNA